MDYSGVKCPVCGKRFGGGDDIVVCPICGAPHHRACYAQRGECVFAAEHMSGKEWVDTERAAREEQNAQTERGRPGGGSPDYDISGRRHGNNFGGNGRVYGDENGVSRRCPRCGQENPKEAIFCQVCGAHLNARGQEYAETRFRFGDPLGGLNRGATIAGLPAQDVARFVGPNSAHYLPRFYHIEKHDAVFSPNVGAFLFGFYFFFYRKMYAIGMLLLAVFVAGTVPLILVLGQLGPELGMEWLFMRIPLPPGTVNATLLTVLNSMQSLGWVTRFFFFLFANRFYMKHVVGRMGRLAEEKGENGSATWYQEELAERGGVDRTTTALLVGGIFIATAIGLMLAGAV